MPEPAQTSPCPIVAKLVAMLLESRSGSPLGEAESMFSRLLDLEAEARREQAPDASRDLVARVRRIAGTGVVIPFPQRAPIANGAARTLR